MAGGPSVRVRLENPHGLSQPFNLQGLSESDDAGEIGDERRVRFVDVVGRYAAAEVEDTVDSVQKRHFVVVDKRGFEGRMVRRVCRKLVGVADRVERMRTDLRRHEDRMHSDRQARAIWEHRQRIAERLRHLVFRHPVCLRRICRHHVCLRRWRGRRWIRLRTARRVVERPGNRLGRLARRRKMRGLECQCGTHPAPKRLLTGQRRRTHPDQLPCRESHYDQPVNAHRRLPPAGEPPRPAAPLRWNSRRERQEQRVQVRQVQRVGQERQERQVEPRRRSAGPAPGVPPSA